MNIPKLPTEQELRIFIKDQLGLEPDVVDAHPVILGHVSLLPFGVCGALVIYRGDDGVVRAGPCPFGVTASLKDLAA